MKRIVATLTMMVVAGLTGPPLLGQVKVEFERDRVRLEGSPPVDQGFAITGSAKAVDSIQFCIRPAGSQAPVGRYGRDPRCPTPDDTCADSYWDQPRCSGNSQTWIPALGSQAFSFSVPRLAYKQNYQVVFRAFTTQGSGTSRHGATCEPARRARPQSASSSFVCQTQHTGAISPRYLLNDKANSFTRSDFGLLWVPGRFGLEPAAFVGVNLHIRPVNFDLPTGEYWKCGLRCLSRVVALHAGLAVTAVAGEEEYQKFWQTGSPMLGLSARVNQTTRVMGGVLAFRQPNGDPFGGRETVFRGYLGVSTDYLLGNVASALRGLILGG